MPSDPRPPVAFPALSSASPDPRTPSPNHTQPSSTQPSSTQPSSTQPSSTQPSSTHPTSAAFRLARWVRNRLRPPGDVETGERGWRLPSKGAMKRGAIAVWMVGPMVTLPVAVGYAVHKRRVDPRAAALFGTGYLVTGLGITAGYHRLLTHKSYRTTSPTLEAVVLFAGALAGQGPPSHWAATHTTHHSHTDKPGDPHSPHVDFDETWIGTLRGFVHAQVGWLYEDPSEITLKHTERIRAGSATVRWLDDHYLPVLVGGLLAPGLVAGWQGVVWGGLVRMLLVNHATFAVNSICHMYGERRFETDDESRNNTFIALITNGEGNHNNHHAFPRMAYHGIGWREYDLTAIVLRLAERAGLITDVVKPTADQIAERVERLRRSAERRAAREADEQGQLRAEAAD